MTDQQKTPGQLINEHMHKELGISIPKWEDLWDDAKRRFEAIAAAVLETAPPGRAQVVDGQRTVIDTQVPSGGQVVVGMPSCYQYKGFATAVMPRWVSVGERFPPYEESVLVREDNGEHSVAFWLDRWIFYNVSGSYFCEDSAHVTHWMPLPQPPEVKT